jgi:hypothetical protein
MATQEETMVTTVGWGQHTLQSGPENGSQNPLLEQPEAKGSATTEDNATNTSLPAVTPNSLLASLPPPPYQHSIPIAEPSPLQPPLQGIQAPSGGNEASGETTDVFVELQYQSQCCQLLHPLSIRRINGATDEVILAVIGAAVEEASAPCHGQEFNAEARKLQWMCVVCLIVVIAGCVVLSVLVAPVGARGPIIGGGVLGGIVGAFGHKIHQVQAAYAAVTFGILLTRLSDEGSVVRLASHGWRVHSVHNKKASACDMTCRMHEQGPVIYLARAGGV